jgi:hypothetical protein
MNISELQRQDTPRDKPSATLLSGSRISFYRGCGKLASRLQLSAGTRRAADDPDLASLYAEDTFVPRAPWRQLSDKELAQLSFDPSRGGQEWNSSTDVAIICIPSDIVRNFTDILDQHRICDNAKAEYYRSITKQPLWKENSLALRDHLTRISRGHLDQIYLRVAEADQLTLTKDEFGAEGKRHRRAGLHVDHWDGLPLRHRHRARNRICINLSREPRYALFFNLPMWDMFKSIGMRDPEDVYSDFRGFYLGQRFMKAWPDYPVVRMRLDPGEAYILPTDNLIHDASTEGNHCRDITLTYLGQFVAGT